MATNLALESLRFFGALVSLVFDVWLRALPWTLPLALGMVAVRWLFGGYGWHGKEGE